MKRPKFVFVPQRTENDCGTCCLAMVTGHTYEKVWSQFRDLRGDMKVTFMVDYLTDCGLTVISKKVESFSCVQNSNKQMIKPFADIHIVSAQQYLDLKFNHAFVMKKNGTIVDPHLLGHEIKHKKDFHYWELILGVYYN